LGKLVYYMDDDGDGYGNYDMVFEYCPQSVPEGLVSNHKDCDDENNLVWELDECKICGGSGKVKRCYDNDGDGLGSRFMKDDVCPDTGKDWVEDCTDLDEYIYCESNELDCAGTLCGSLIIDECGICGGNGPLQYRDCEGTCLSNLDCNDDCNGTANIDNCGDCTGGLTSSLPCEKDCNGVWGGNAYKDPCGSCDSNPANDCQQDCNGVWGGDGKIDNCEICDNDPNNDCIRDCNHVWGGNAVLDNCGLCDDNLSNDCLYDCNEVWGGSAKLDNCGVCDSNEFNDCFQDCYGIWGGFAKYDRCGICGGDGSLCCEDGSLKKSYNSKIITVLDSSRCFNQSDLAVLQEFINLNKSLNGKEPLGIGKQSWKNRRLIYLYLDKQSITILPSNLGDLNKIEVLSFSHNQLTTLPENIGDLSNLVGLAAENNQLISLPESLWKLSNLTELHCNNNFIKNLPESIGKLENLQRLQISNNKLFSLPESIGTLSHLEYMDVSRNQMTYLPKTICLLHLNIYFNSFIAGNNFICDNIPECVEEFPGFNYEFNDSGAPEFVSQNCSSCGKEYTEINVKPENIAVLDNNNCFLKKDLKVLEGIITKNEYLNGKKPLNIGKQIWDDGRIISLTLHNLQLKKLPSNLGDLSKLKKLSINSNQITSIPNSIGKLTNLIELNLHENQLSNLPESIGNLLQLKRLKVDHNNLSSLPKSISNLNKLVELQINRNELKSLPNNICNINFDKNKMQNFISGNNYLCEDIPSCTEQLPGFNYEFDSNGYPFYQPQNCVICDPGFRGILQIPDNITIREGGNCFFKSDLDAIQDIINTNNKLSNLEPLDVGYQVWIGGRITTLAINNANLQSLPKSIGNLTSLQILHLDNNKLTSLPKSIGNLNNLTELALDENQITILPNSIGNLTNLQGISMDNNKLTTLPETIGDLNNLRELYLNYNQITILPESFGNLKNLEILLIYYNQLTSLPRSIGNLNNLQVLYSSNNQITSIPESIANLSNLHKLWISSNQLTTLPISLCELPSDCDINVSYNCLSEEFHYSCIDNAGHHLGYWCK